MKTPTDAAKILLNEGWMIEDVVRVLAIEPTPAIEINNYATASELERMTSEKMYSLAKRLEDRLVAAE